MSTKKHKRPWGVFLAILLAMIFGSWVGAQSGIFGITFYAIVDVIGTIFLNALTLVVVPLVSSSIITGVSRIGNEGAFGKLGGKMFFFYLTTSLIAILIGLFFVDILHPGREPVALSTDDASALKEKITHSGANVFVQVLISIIPSNIVAAFSKGEMLGMIFFSLLFGYSLSKIEGAPGTTLQNFFDGIFQTMIRLTQIIMKLLPVGVFCLVSKTFMSTGIQSLKAVSLFFATVILGLATFMFIAIPILLKFVARVKPMRHFKAMAPALVTAFSTSSSSATLPITMDCVEKRAGVSNRICSLVVPLGTSINMSGSALYECVAAMFVAQSYGIDLTFGTQFLIVAMSLIASLGVAGVPSASLVAIIIILKVVGLPMEGIGLFIAVDRLLDMCRTTVNVFSDSACAILVARSEGEKSVLAHEPL
ncbi:MAG: dicarboxylate/amino acid:cation symporter [Verrucomicrobia bacterium]|nr:dicarboxylate/amino acid:cation symporter [Verrucomicrobiota bacterium]MBU6446641.1 dicarboxylate/amino acid:cation symporter [Verrucomicrobiota bacterium]MDE3047404.1 dicarboxylate/amino acid:cation symporter [Verrucomicrobiota bacterium]